MYENKKISKIVDEAVTYLLGRDATYVGVSIEKGNDKVIVTLVAENVNINNQALDDLKDYLNSTHREAETEEYYWHLAGEGRTSEEMALVAIMVDEAQIYYEDKKLKMVFLRKM
ncbi:hypothetical protein HMPREF1142_1061 [Peptostreptococcaceae bacterium AS15]|nr:hypothetical protein HMPREF0379_1662 [[Eubacterium] yurii subsp. margaretiae ATCC 43715]EJP23126.1 hypothetical protein HMPREF1142_1061 [Peptostreptococcaceae bacterium AS15]